MKAPTLIGLSILMIIWLYLAWLLLSSGGVNLKNLLILAISGIIVFVPLCKKYFTGRNDNNK